MELKDLDSMGVQRTRVFPHRHGNDKEEGPCVSSLAKEPLFSWHFLSGGSGLLDCSGSTHKAFLFISTRAAAFLALWLINRHRYRSKRIWFVFKQKEGSFGACHYLPLNLGLCFLTLRNFM